MADFHEGGLTTTFPRLDGGSQRNAQDYHQWEGPVRREEVLKMMEKDLESIGQQTKIGLILPALYSEFETPAMGNILKELAKVSYIGHTVLVLDQADKHQYAQAYKAFVDAGIQNFTFIWNKSDRMVENYHLLEDGLVGHDSPYKGFLETNSKGRSMWLATGYLAAKGCDIIASHDCDITTYDREMLARLIYPVAKPVLNPGTDSQESFQFSKGYYARLGPSRDQMQGRVARLMVNPFLTALEEMPNVQANANAKEMIRYLREFRYPLSGEFAAKTSAIIEDDLPGNWGVEIGMLANLEKEFRGETQLKICQVELSDNYDHKHQNLSSDDSTKGLNRMSRDIAKTVFRALEAEGVRFSEEDFAKLEFEYIRKAHNTVQQYCALATFNHLVFNIDAERNAVNTFNSGIKLAAEEAMQDSIGIQLPSWRKVDAMMGQGFRPKLLMDIQMDNELVRDQKPTRKSGIDFSSTSISIPIERTYERELKN